MGAGGDGDMENETCRKACFSSPDWASSVSRKALVDAAHIAGFAEAKVLPTKTGNGRCRCLFLFSYDSWSEGSVCVFCGENSTRARNFMVIFWGTRIIIRFHLSRELCDSKAGYGSTYLERFCPLRGCRNR